MHFGIVLKGSYGLKLEDFDKLLIEQSGLCAICLSPLEKPYVDHDHRTKKVRGLLCLTCNLGLGHFCESPELLRHAASYLER